MISRWILMNGNLRIANVCQARQTVHIPERPGLVDFPATSWNLPPVWTARDGVAA